MISRSTLSLVTIFGISIACSSEASAQLGIGTNNPDPSAYLQIESADKGILVPRVADTNLVANPAKGLLIYRTTSPGEGFYFNEGTASASAWRQIAKAGTDGLIDGSVTANKIASQAVQNQHILPNAVTTSKVANGTITTSKLADSAVSGLKLLTWTVGDRHIAVGALSPSKIGMGPNGAYNRHGMTWNNGVAAWTDINGYQWINANTTISDGGSGQFFMGGNFTITLPATPSLGQTIRLVSSYPGATINMNGKSLYNLATGTTASTASYTFNNSTGLKQKCEFIWDGTNWLYAADL